MTKQFTALILVLSLVLCPVAVFAIDASLTGDVITIRGSGYAPEGRVPVMITKPDISPEGLNDATIDQNIIMIYEPSANAQGSLTFKSRLPAGSPAGWYTAWAGIESDGFYYATDAEIDSAVAAFATATVSTIGGAIQTYSVSKPIVYLDLDGLYDEYTSYVQKVFVSELGANNPSDIPDIQQCYALSLDIIAFSKGSSADVYSLLEESGYSSYTDSINSAADVADMVINLRPSEMYALSEVASVMRKANAIVALNNSSKTTVMSKVADYNDVLELDLTGDYVNCDSSEVAKVLAGQCFTSIEAVRSAFTSRVAYLTSGAGQQGYTPSQSGNTSPGFSASVGTATTVTPTEPSVSHSFADLAGYEWAQGYIATLSKKGVINGVSATMYAPGESVTREQYLKMLCLAFGAKGAVGTDSFDDTDPNAWYAPYVLWGVQNGITNGMSDTLFGIGESITREDMCVMAKRASDIYAPGLGTAPVTFVDAELIADYAFDAVAALAGSGIINGRPDGSFDGKNNLTRAEAAKVVYLLMQKGGAFGD